MRSRDSYLDAVRSGVPAWSFRRAGLLREVGDGLDDAVAARRDDGVPAEEAERAAIAEFGTPGEVARSIRDELAVGAGRTAALTVGMVSALQMVVAGLMWRADGSEHGFPELPTGYGVLAMAVDVMAVVILVGGVVAWMALGTTRRVGRRWDRVRMTRGVGIGVLAAVLVQSLGGTALSALGPGLAATVSSPVDVVRSVVPFVVLVLVAVPCLRLTSGRRAPGEYGADDPTEGHPVAPR